MSIWEKTITSIQEKFADMTPEGKRRFALICTAVVVVLLTISVIISISGSDGGQTARKSAEKSQDSAPEFLVRIPAEELFLPDEPDYLPDVILERERREVWTEEDASEFWQDPLRFGEEQWREKIHSAVDELLERVP